MKDVYISLGSNIGDRYLFLQNALLSLQNHAQIKVVLLSSIYETEPVGFVEQGAFLNMVVHIQTSISAYELLEEIGKIEYQQGRKREIRFGPRTLDIDILLFGDHTINSETLQIPHPRMFERNFVLVPLSEIKQEIESPALEGMTIWKNQDEVQEDFERLLKNTIHVKKHNFLA